MLGLFQTACLHRREEESSSPQSSFANTRSSLAQSAGDVLALAGHNRWGITCGLIKTALRSSGIATSRSVVEKGEELVWAAAALTDFFLLSPEEHQLLNDHLTACVSRGAAQTGIGASGAPRRRR